MGSPTGQGSRKTEAKGNLLMMRLFPEDQANLKTIVDYLNGLDLFSRPVNRTGALRWAMHRMARDVCAGELLDQQPK